MCGIAGILRFAGTADDTCAVQRMLGSLARRGPDDSGLARSGGATFGHRRLAIIDRSSAGHQPMADPSGRLLLTFNGEIYNYRELSTELGLDPSRLRSGSDSEVMLHAWLRWGPEALPRLVGHWSFALFDAEAKRLWLVRDRFGERPLFWHRTPERLVFASSIAALVQAPDVPRDLDIGAAVEFLTLRYVIAPRTVVRDIRKVRPGHYVEASSTTDVREEEWFSPRFRALRSRRRTNGQERSEVFRALFEQACQRCMVSDVTVGLLLSDGIDSNAIRTALLEGGYAPPAFTFRAHDRLQGMSDLDGAPGGPIEEVSTPPNGTWDTLERVLASLTEPVGDSASLSTWCLLREARQSATVFLCGHGGDEILGGYRLSQARFRLAALRRLAWLNGAPLDRSYARHLNGDESLDVRRQRLRTRARREAPAAALYLIDRPLPASEIGQLLDGHWPLDEPYLGTIRAMYAECAEDATDLDRIQEVLMRSFLSANILSYADSVAMDHSAELRMPFLDRDLVDFVFGLSSSERVGRWPGRTNTKLPLRRWARGKLPEAILARPKRGFASGHLSALLSRHGEQVRARILDSRSVRRVMPGVEGWLSRDESQSGACDGTLWGLLGLSIWSDTIGGE